MTAKVIPYTGITRLDLEPDQVLESAKGELAGLVIVGFTVEGDEYFASTYADGLTVNWLLDRAKTRLMATVDEYEGA